MGWVYCSFVKESNHIHLISANRRKNNFMCGIIGGFWQSRPAKLTDLVKNAIKKLKHRGPDADDYCVQHTHHGVLTLAHTRLAIIDLSDAGRQPMQSRDGRFVIVFNGEIYNYKELRHELKAAGHVFFTDTDTEVLLVSWIQWKTDCLQKLKGMFAFAVYDKFEEKLYCARDAFGIKPFFYFQNTGKFIFASEISALTELMDAKLQPDLQRCYDYLINGDYDSQENTFFKGIKHLLPGSSLFFDLKTQKLCQPSTWWSPATKEQKISFQDATDLIRSSFLENVGLHLRSDVSLGAALSGGIDSSAVVCAMRYLEPEADIHTFSFIAKGSNVSEEKWIDQLNSHVNAISHKVIAATNELLEDLDKMIQAQGEPFGSTSIYAQYKVFQLARESGITVVLDGQGADELLAGYFGYPGHRLLSLLESGCFIRAMKFVKQWAKWPGRDIVHPWMWLGRILLPDVLYMAGRKILKKDFKPAWLNIERFIDAGVVFAEFRPSLKPEYKGRRVIEQLATSLRRRGLPALLRHEDRNSMHFSIESRVPFLTIGMADKLLSLPEHYLISDNGETKSIFRAAMRDIVPDIILNRRDKIGFATPENAWILQNTTKWRNLLKEAEAIDFINAQALLKEFDILVASGKLNQQIWRWINFVRWFQMFM